MEISGGSVSGRVKSKCNDPEAEKLMGQENRVVGYEDIKVGMILTTVVQSFNHV